MSNEVFGPVTLEIYIPERLALSWIKLGSAIVGKYEAGKDYVTIYFEGNCFGASNMQTWEDKLIHAIGRLIRKYPTTAKMLTSRALLYRVGTWTSGPGSDSEKAFWKEATIHIEHDSAQKKLDEWKAKA